MMKLTIDEDRCEGHGRCYSLFPDHFSSDDEGRAIVVGEGLDDSSAELARQVIANCPERAIEMVVDVS